MENFNNDPVVEDVVETSEAPAVEETKIEEPIDKADDAVKAPSYPRVSEPQVIAPVANGAIGTAPKPAVKKEKPVQVKKDVPTVAIRSTKNVSWIGVGKVSKGINIVTEDEAAEWLTRDHITKVEPTDVAKEYGN